jgi:hypothetical protein
VSSYSYSYSVFSPMPPVRESLTIQREGDG